MSKIIGNSLPPEIIELFNKQLTTVTLSTISKEGYPHAMPVHLIIAKDSKTIRMALVKVHKTVENIKANGEVFITVLEEGDQALGIRGKAKIVKEPMDGNIAMCIVEVKVEEIKSDTTPTVIVEKGITFKHRSEKTEHFFHTMFSELRA